MKTLKKIPLIPIILGVLVLAYAITSKIVNKGFFSLTDIVGNIVIAVGLIAFAVLVVLPQISKGTGLNKTLRTIEFVIIIIGSIIGFILPLFKVEVPYIGSGSLWLGLTLVLDGAITLYVGAGKGLKYFISLISVILGTWVYSTNFVNKNIELFTLIALIVIGVTLLLIGLIGYMGKNKSNKA